MSQSSHYDVIIIGSGAGGATLAHRLAASGKRILILERGDWLPREPQNWDSREVFGPHRYATTETWRDSDGKAFVPATHYVVGGNTKVYGAALFRLRESDFDETVHADGMSPAWPLKYADFAPYYLEAEQLYQVHGTRGSDPSEPPEAAPYPFGALAHEPAIAELDDALRRAGSVPFPLPMALRVNDADPAQSACIRCAAQRFSLSNPTASDIEARYFRDPEGHPLELIRFPADKGSAQWHAAHGRDNALFLGIDHNAIVVANTDASVAFYRRYGVAARDGSSVNQGMEQEWLTDVRDARVRITPLSGANGIGLELLEYLAPRDGRSSPSDGGPDDAWFARALIAGVQEKGLAIDGVDPDGHGVRLT